jgi:hypothetical protein
MKRWKIAGVMVMSAGVLGAASNQAEATEACKQIQAHIVDAPTTENCSSVFCAAGAVTGNQDLNGTTFFTEDGGVRGPATAPAYIAVSGILTYTTPRGTLTVRETGISSLNLAAHTGAGAAVQDVLSGTGRFEGATGHLYLAQRTGDGVFISDVSGGLCLG